MKFGETVPAGFIIECTSWENDGDDYKTIQKRGRTRGFVDVVLALAPLFGSCNSRRNGGFGNTSSDEVDELNLVEAVQEALKDIPPVVCQGVLGFDVMGVDLLVELAESSDDQAEWDKKLNEIASHVSDFVHENITGYSEWYEFRVAETVKVYYLPEPVVIPAVEEVNTLSVR